MLTYGTASTPALADIDASIGRIDDVQNNLSALVTALRAARNSDRAELANVYDRLNDVNAEPTEVVRGLRSLLPAVTRQKQTLKRARRWGLARRPNHTVPLPLGSNGASQTAFSGQHAIAGFPLNAAAIGADSLLPRPQTDLWLQLWSDQGVQDTTDNLLGFDAQASGISLGVDLPLNAAWTLTTALGYTESDVDAEQFGDDTDEALEFTSNVTWITGDHTLSAGLGINHTQTNRLRVIIANAGNGPRRYPVQASFDSAIQTLHAAYAYTFAVRENLLLTPSASLGWLKLATDDYTESGAGALSLDVQTADQTQVTGSLGFDAQWFAEYGNWLVSPGLGLLFEHDFKTDVLQTTARFRGQDRSFRTHGLAVEDNRWRFSASLSVAHTAGFGASLTYTAHREPHYRYDALALTLQNRF